MSGCGAGVEDVDLGTGKAALAFLAGARPDINTKGSGRLSNSPARTMPSDARRSPVAIGLRRACDGAQWPFQKSKEERAEQR